MAKVRTAEDWAKVYDVLIEHAGAPVSMRSAFISCCVNGELTEWRFQGHLGFGGKIWWRKYDDRLYVTCYPEDEKYHGRRAIINKVNALLATM